ncbi:TM2 domain-containing protein [Malacoplasma penetrans]|nr:TM2 domain-containing protein [Malacoplasma penetrans]
MEGKKQKKKYFLTQEEIIEDSKKANELKQQGLIYDREIPEYWSSGTSPYKKKTNLLLAIFLGFFGADRFYLKKYISAFIKLFFILIVTPVSIYLTVDPNLALYAAYPDIVIVFSILFYGTAAAFYFGDIVIGIVKPRDYDFQNLN